MGSRAAGGFGLVFPEQIAITPDGRTGARCAGRPGAGDRHHQGHGAMPAIQLGHTGRKGSELKPWSPEGSLGWPLLAPGV